MMRALELVAGSWPIAVMFVGLCTAVVVRRSVKQVMDNDRAERLDRQKGNNAVVVQGREYNRNDEE